MYVGYHRFEPEYGGDDKTERVRPQRRLRLKKRKRKNEGNTEYKIQSRLIPKVPDIIHFPPSNTAYKISLTCSSHGRLVTCSGSKLEHFYQQFH